MIDSDMKASRETPSSPVGLVPDGGDRISGAIHAGAHCESSARTTRILWIAPNFNEYKRGFLERLEEASGLKLLVLAGARLEDEGHRYSHQATRLDCIPVAARKRWFAWSPRVYAAVLEALRNRGVSVVLMPIEKKHLPLILYIVALKRFFGFRLCSYNHPSLRSSDGRARAADRAWTRLLFAMYDRVVFYTAAGMQWAVRERLISPKKAAFANNTLDTKTIWSIAPFDVNRRKPPVLLFIGRLIPTKRIDLLFEYVRALRKQLPDLQLRIVGDGPLSAEVRAATGQEQYITWLGALTDERQVADEMKRCHAVFVPGHSGLSIVHAFCYGKPYITLERPDIHHAPEIAYLEDGRNGLMLRGDGLNVEPLVELLKDDARRYADMCREAYQTAQGLSIETWCEQMDKALRGVDK